MNIDEIRNICKKLPGVTEGVKWGNDLCFMIVEKMFCVTSLSTPLTVSLKVKDEEFEELTSVPGIQPAPYVARYKWILITDTSKFNKKQWQHFITQSYDLVKSKIPLKILKKNNL